MLFTDPDFIFIFVPVTVFGFYCIKRFIGAQASYLWLFLASLVFYGFSYPPYILALLISYAINYAGAKRLQSTHSRALLVFMISLNLAYLGYFKYFNFFVENISALTGEQPKSLSRWVFLSLRSSRFLIWWVLTTASFKM
jgi:alginate O-acetyltransferase complex protein AlgI